MMTYISAIEMKAVQAISMRMVSCCGPQIMIQVDDDTQVLLRYIAWINIPEYMSLEDRMLMDTRKDSNTHIVKLLLCSIITLVHWEVSECSLPPALLPGDT